MKITQPTINFQVGIEDILPFSSGETSSNGVGSAFLPNATELTPSSQSTIFSDYTQNPSIEENLHAYLEPEIIHRDVLIPATFTKNMCEAKEYFISLSEDMHSPSLQSALTVLQENSDLQDTLHVYRSMLVQG
ncbi:MAG: hypothetical protein R3Y11_03415 [Pseudomonadota bacterium]